MTHPIQSTDLNNAVQLFADNGFEGMASAIQILFNKAMKLERNEYIGAEPYQRRVAQTIPEGCLGAVAQEALSPWPLKFEPLTSCGIATQTTRNELSEPPADQEARQGIEEVMDRLGSICCTLPGIGKPIRI